MVRPDKIAFTSLIDTYLNYDTLKSNIVISGTIADGANQTFSTTIPYIRSKTRADIYAKNLTTGRKRPITGGLRQSPYTFVSSEICTQIASYFSNNITVSFIITNNSGSSINLINQTIEITAVLYEVPLSI